MRRHTRLRAMVWLGRLRLRSGATIVELLVALVLFDLSLVTLATVSAVAVRRVGEAGRRNRASVAAASRIESLASQPCASSVLGGATLERGVTETWSAVPIAGGRELVDSVVIESQVLERLVLRSRIPC